jgi:plasmid stability protein
VLPVLLHPWLRIATHLAPVPINLSIKNAPDEAVERLRQRTERHHRSRQGELLAIIEEEVRPEQEFTATELLAEVRGRVIRTPGDFAAIIRADRDWHDGG